MTCGLIILRSDRLVRLPGRDWRVWIHSDDGVVAGLRARELRRAPDEFLLTAGLLGVV